MENQLGKVGLIGRFKPLHNGGYELLEAVCKKADRVIIGIGSSNKYNSINPFTASETEAMIRAALYPQFSNFDIIYLPDFGNSEQWKDEVRKNFGNLDYFVSGNQYVAEILKEDYRILHPFDLIPKNRQLKLNSTEVRIKIAKDKNWRRLVPEAVAGYLEKNHLIERFIREFGKQTLEYANNKFHRSAEEEKMRVMEAGN
jgi:nicotinamide-nucleotide adenylyltransferase